MRSSTLKFGRLSALSALFSTFALGCVISLGSGGKQSDECPDPNSTLSNGECFCKAFYDWCKPDNLDDLTCCESQTSNSNSESNTATDPSNGTGTTDEPTSGTTESIPTSGTTGDPIECTVDADPPASCDANTEFFLCLSATNTDCGPEGSKYYVCEGGSWVEKPNGADESCVADGYDFGVGCHDDGAMVVIDCGVGPGTACTTGSPAACNGETSLEECIYGKLTATDCTAYCMEVGVDGVQYDYGYCGDQRGTLCICCDEGDEGCPINEGTTGEGTSTGGGESTGTTGA